MVSRKCRNAWLCTYSGVYISTMPPKTWMANPGTFQNYASRFLPTNTIQYTAIYHTWTSNIPTPSNITRRSCSLGGMQLEKLRAVHALEKKEAMSEFKAFKSTVKERETHIQVIRAYPLPLFCVLQQGGHSNTKHIKYIFGQQDMSRCVLTVMATCGYESACRACRKVAGVRPGIFC